MFRFVLFDLDGTVSDPKEGICKCVQYALKAQNMDEPDLDKLEPFIGPPLKNSFMEFYGMDEQAAEAAVEKYRERFSTIGLYENELYPGMKEFLQSLQSYGVKLAIASSKPKIFVNRILKHFQIAEYFDVVCGSELNGKKVEKADVMREAISKLFHIREESVADTSKNIVPWNDILMVGDRKFDVEGAKIFGIKCAGVSYGYAAEGELEEAGADFVTDELDALHQYITGNQLKLSVQGGKSRFFSSIRILMPVVYEYLLSLILLLTFRLGLDYLMQGLLQKKAGWLSAHSSVVAVCFDVVATVVCTIVFYRWYQKEKKRPISQVVRRRRKKHLKRDWALIACVSVCLALFLNILFSLLKLTNVSQGYSDVAATQYSVPLLLGLLHYGLIKPVEEELVFRGLVYGRMRENFSPLVSIPISALVFGAYHGNLVQLIYAFFMGCFLAYIYERYKSLKAAILVHGSANLAVYLVSSITVIGEAVVSPVGCVVSGVLAGGLLIWVGKRNLSRLRTGN